MAMGILIILKIPIATKCHTFTKELNHESK